MNRRSVLMLTGMVAAPPLSARQTGSAGRICAMARRVFNKTNELRRVRGAAELEWSDSLSLCARQQCERKKVLRFPGHDDPQLGGVAQRLSSAGIRWTRCAENLFEIKGYTDPVDFAIVFWWYSAGHQSNMLNPDFRRSGVAVAIDAEERFFVTQIFVAG